MLHAFSQCTQESDSSSSTLCGSSCRVFTNAVLCDCYLWLKKMYFVMLHMTCNPTVPSSQPCTAGWAVCTQHTLLQRSIYDAVTLEHINYGQKGGTYFQSITETNIRTDGRDCMFILIFFFFLLQHLVAISDITTWHTHALYIVYHTLQVRVAAYMSVSGILCVWFVWSYLVCMQMPAKM